MKKKKKSKKAAFDLEAFEKELEDASKPTEADADEDGEDGPAPAIDYDDEELGEDVFAAPAGGGGGDSFGDAVETWHGTDRDYTYAEVRLSFILRTCVITDDYLYISAPRPHNEDPPRPKSRAFLRWREETIHHRPAFRSPRRKQEDHLRQRR